MKFASLLETPMSDFAAKARAIPRCLESLFGRSLYCNIVNPSSLPENLIFFLRYAKKTELYNLKENHHRDEHAEIIDSLVEIVKEAYPRLIANFRLVRDEGNFSKVYLRNEMGEKSETVNVNFLLPGSSRTLRVRCLNLGNFNWHGTDRMIKPFVDYCLFASAYIACDSR